MGRLDARGKVGFGLTEKIEIPARGQKKFLSATAERLVIRPAAAVATFLVLGQVRDVIESYPACVATRATVRFWKDQDEAYSVNIALWTGDCDDT